MLDKQLSLSSRSYLKTKVHGEIPSGPWLAATVAHAPISRSFARRNAMANAPRRTWNACCIDSADYGLRPRCIQLETLSTSVRQSLAR